MVNSSASTLPAPDHDTFAPRAIQPEYPGEHPALQNKFKYTFGLSAAHLRQPGEMSVPCHHPPSGRGEGAAVQS